MNFNEQLGDLNQYQVYAPNESPGARQRRAQRERKEQIEKQQQMEICISGLIAFYLFINLIMYKAEPNCGNYKTWLIYSLLFYILDTIVALNQLMYIMKSGRESIWYHLGMYIVLIANTSWYIYGNVIYYRDANYCLEPTNPGSAMKMTQAMFVMIIIGYCTMCKCCCITTFLCVAVPLMYRRANRPNWEQAAPGMLRRLATGKFQPPDEEQGVDGVPSCIICMVEYTEQDTVVTLPCDKRHYFHDECIKSWLSKNNSCPLCKKPITEEDLKKQKRELQGQASRN